MYLYSGIADVAALTGDKQFLDAIDRIWDNMAGKKVYVQGGIGAVGSGERFGGDYELPNRTAYNETCAAIGEVFWNQRMFLLHGDAKYIDLLEKVLYNGLLSGVGLDGNRFFIPMPWRCRRERHIRTRNRRVPAGSNVVVVRRICCGCCLRCRGISMRRKTMNYISTFLSVTVPG